MKYHWTVEKFGYACRGSNAAPWALITKAVDGYTAALIKPGFPSNGPFRAPQTAAAQAEKMLRRTDVVKASDTISRIPETRARKCA